MTLKDLRESKSIENIVGDYISKELNSVTFYDEGLKRQIKKLKSINFNSITIWYKEAIPANGKKVYKYYFDIESSLNEDNNVL